MCSWWKRRGAVVSEKSNSRTAGLASGLGSSCHTGMVDRPAVGRTPLRVRQPFEGPGRPQCERPILADVCLMHRSRARPERTSVTPATVINLGDEALRPRS
ncbi:hypothetical protein OKW34_002565 [Paraburkholderia youngii]